MVKSLSYFRFSCFGTILIDLLLIRISMPKERKIKNPPNRANTTEGLKCANNNPETMGPTAIPIYLIKLNIPIALPLLCSNSFAIIVANKGVRIPIDIPWRIKATVTPIKVFECVTANNITLKAKTTFPVIKSFFCEILD